MFFCGGSLSFFPRYSFRSRYSTCRSSLGYLFVRSFFIYTRGLRTHPPYLRPLTLCCRSFKRHDYCRCRRDSKPFYPLAEGKKKKLMGAFEWMLLIELTCFAGIWHVQSSSLLSIGVTCCNWCLFLFLFIFFLNFRTLSASYPRGDYIF